MYCLNPKFAFLSISESEIKNLFAKINRCAFAAEQSKSGGQARLGNPLNQGLSYAVRKTAAGFDFSKRKCSAAITPQPLYHAVQPFCNARVLYLSRLAVLVSVN